MNRPDKDKLTATAATAIILVLLLAGLMFGRFSVDLSQDREWPPVDSSEIVFGGEFVKMGDLPTPAESANEEVMPQSAADEPTHDGTDIDNQGEAVIEDPSKITVEQESPAKEEAKPKLEKTGPTKEELAEQARIKREQEQVAQRKKISSNIKNRFNKSSKQAKGKTGSTTGNSDNGVLSGTPGYSLKGRTPESWGYPSSTFDGTITIRVKVNRQGHVIDASYASGTGAAAAQQSVRLSCIAAAKKSRFSVDLDAPAEQIGTITWTFK
ncbi:MAG: hypothetical protein NC127_01030 [Muribaculum sp.]|nr:hypothetical protein [Muribaculum sp.]